MMKRTATLIAFILLVLTLCTATAGASSSSACNLSITKFVIHPSTGAAPAKIGFTTYMAGNVTRVRYQVLNKTTGAVVASCSSYCAHCTKLKICTCSLTIKQAGTYDAKVIAYGTGTCSVTLVKKSAITIKDSPLTASFNCTTSGKKVTFADKSTGATKWTWSFGDGSKSTLENPTHTYTKAGTYKVCLTVCNSLGTCKSLCKSITIKDSPLTASFNCTTSGKKVTFTDKSTGATKWTWSFGDGSKSTLENPTHAYTKAGTYKVCLTACNSAGTCKSLCKSVTVK